MGQFSASSVLHRGTGDQVQVHPSLQDRATQEAPLFLQIAAPGRRAGEPSRWNLKFTSTLVPPSSEAILYLLSYCSVVRLRLHSLQI